MALLLAVAVVDPDLVDTGDVDDGEIVVECRLWIWTAIAGLVPELYANTEVFECRRSKMTPDPDLLMPRSFNASTPSHMRGSPSVCEADFDGGLRLCRLNKIAVDPRSRRSGTLRVHARTMGNLH